MKTCKICQNRLNRGASTYCSSKCFGFDNRSNPLSKTRQSSIWQHMRQRCDNPKNAAYKNYGGRGIKYDPRWSKFFNFWNDMKEGYSPDLTLERIDVNGNYCKQNCKWATRKEQSCNTRRNIRFNFNGQKLTLKEVADLVGINYYTLHSRIFLYKIPFEQAIEKRSFVSGRKLSFIHPIK